MPGTPYRPEKTEYRRKKRIAQRQDHTICFACRQKGHPAANCPVIRNSTTEGNSPNAPKTLIGVCYRYVLHYTHTSRTVLFMLTFELDVVRRDTRLHGAKNPLILPMPSPSQVASFVQRKDTWHRYAPRTRRKGSTPTVGVVNCAATTHTWLGTVNSERMVSLFRLMVLGILSKIGGDHRIQPSAGAAWHRCG